MYMRLSWFYYPALSLVIFNYKQFVLTADQKEYKLITNVQGFKVIKTVLQIVVVIYFCNGYVFWLILELLMGVVTVFVLNAIVKKSILGFKLHLK